MARFTSLLPLISLIAGCVIDTTGDDTHCADGKCDGGEDACYVEHRYENGTCDTDCAQSDPDCFLFFADQPKASTWFTTLEAKLAMQEVREPRAVVPTTDPRFKRMRELLDRGWQSYKKVMPVGLIDRAPELVVIDDPTPNAFVALDEPSNKAAWVVMVQTGAMTDQPDHALLGVVMHELTHAAKLHIMKGMADKIRVHYQVRPSEGEPIGKDQTDSPRVREAITAWRKVGEDAGPNPYVELNGVPGSGGLLGVMLNAAFSHADTSHCQATGPLLQQLNAFLTSHTNMLSGLLEVSSAADRSELDQLSRAVVTNLRTECLASVQLDLFELMAMHFGVTKAEIEEKFPAAEQAAVAGKHIVDQITLLTADRYRRMIDIAVKVQQDSGRDITTLRYFSTEEAADDATVPVLRDMGLPVDGVGTFFHVLLGDEVGAQCDAMIAAKTTPPYGDLVDEHHATCWRIAHVKQLGALESAARRLPIDNQPATGEYLRMAGASLPRWPLPSDAVMH